MSKKANESVACLFDLPGKNIPYVLGGSTLSGMDCVGLLRYWLKQNGIECPYKNTHDFCRNMLTAWPEPIKAPVPVGAVVAIIDNAPAPERYTDGLPFVSHLYVKIGDGTLLHASAGNKKVLTRDFADKAIPNGGPTHFGMVKWLDYGDGESAPGTPPYEYMTDEGREDSWVPAAPDKTAVVVAENGKPVKMRAKPSKTESLYWYVPVGAVVSVYSASGGWAKIRYQGRNGYMMDEFLQAGGGPG